jgi:hypothetical protein
VARILPEAVIATWEVHRLRKIHPTASRVSGYFEKPVTAKRPLYLASKNITYAK